MEVTLPKIFKYGELMKNLVLKELKLRYKRSVLGFFWSLLNPLLMMIVYWIVFSQIFGRYGLDNYHIYLLSGLLPWGFFSVSLSNASLAILDNANLIKKIYLPREIFPIATVLANLVNFLLSLLVLVGLLIAWRMPIGAAFLALPLVIFIHLTFTMGLAFFLSCMNVFFGDTVQLLEIILTAWFFMCPIIYPVSLIAGRPFVEGFYYLNPMVHIITSYQQIFYLGVFPDPKNLIISALVAVGSFVLGWALFKRAEPTIAKSV